MNRYSSTKTIKRWDGKQTYITTRYPIIKPKINELSTIYNLEYDMPADILNNEYDPTIFSNSLFTINNTAGVWIIFVI